MAKKKDIIREIPDEEIELFGAHKTKEEVKAAEKARKAKERAELKAEAAARRKEGMSGHPALKEMLPVIVVCGIIVVLCVVLLVIQFNRAEDSKAWLRNEDLGHFTYIEVAPTLKEQEITYQMVEAYYTNNGYLQLRMILGNGDKADYKLEEADIELWNGDDAYIGGGKVVLTDPLIIPAEGSVEYKCKIAPEHLAIKDDSLETLSYLVTPFGEYITDDNSTTD